MTPRLDQTCVLRDCAKCGARFATISLDALTCQGCANTYDGTCADETEDGIRGGQGRTAASKAKNGDTLGWVVVGIAAVALVIGLYEILGMLL